MSRGLILGAALWLSACAGGSGDIGARVETALEERGLGRDALAMIDNIVSHQGATPAGVDPAVAAYLRDPLSIFQASATLDRFDAATDLDTGIQWSPPGDMSDAMRGLIARYVGGMRGARAALTIAFPIFCCRPEQALSELTGGARAAPALEELVAAADRDALDRAVRIFVATQARAVADMAAISDSDLESLKPGAFDSPIGMVRIGSAGADRHDRPAALIIDPGGNDSYFRDLDVGAVSAVMDFAGDDRYEGQDTALLGLSAVLDRSGNDFYRTPGSGVAAAVGGAALIHDGAGDDRYEGDVFAVGAASAGFALLIDDSGDDRYLLGARGQGFGGPLGFAMVHDRAGNDAYRATGLDDPFERSGGRLSHAQGVGAGFRSALAGGTGVLRDDAGNDTYQAEKFAQGQGYFYGFGMLLDGAGDDGYTAGRYAQGQGAHGGVGLLEDRSGDDDYRLDVGVGQGMGLDVGIGVLADLGGDDRYGADSLAQGSTTGNGFGLLADFSGDDIYFLGKPGLGWGRGRGSRGLPGLPLLVDGRGGDSHLLSGELMIHPSPRELGGPLAGRDSALPPPARFDCPGPGGPSDAIPGQPIDWLGRSAPLFGSGKAALAAHARLIDGLPDILPQLLSALPAGDVSLTGNLNTLVRCFMDSAKPAQLDWIGAILLAALDAGTPHASLAVALLRRVPPPGEVALALARRLRSDPDCGTRSGALLLARAALGGDAAMTEAVASLALEALDDTCWQAKAAALALLGLAQGRDDAELSEAAWNALPGPLKSRAVIAGAPPESEP